MPNRITIIGTGTVNLNKDRVASSVLIQVENTNILYDCGHGVCQRLSEIGLFPNMIDHIIISHFHPDHVSDLIPYFHANAWAMDHKRENNTNIYGPPGIDQLTKNILALFGPGDLIRDYYKILIHEISDQNFTIGKHRFQFISLPPYGNHGLKFSWENFTIAITGDSSFHQKEIDFLSNVDLAIIDSGHLSTNDITELARCSNAKKIICSHFYKPPDIDTIQRNAQDGGVSGNIIKGEDLMMFDF